MNALEIVGKNIGNVRLVASGAGAAALACLDLLVRLGLHMENIWITDTYPLSTTWIDWWWVNHSPSWVTATHNLTDRQAIFWVESIDPGNTASLGFNIMSLKIQNSV